MPAIPFEVNDPELRERFFRHLLFDALSGLRENAPAAWGKMAAEQMVEHLLWAFEVSTGRAQAECSFPAEQRERFKTFLYDNRPTPHDFQNPALAAGLPPLRYAGLAAATAALRVEVDRFLREAAATPATARMHPVFGPIGAEEWARSHFKHCYHHLLQFGLISQGNTIS
jgi:hypothetical protein